MADRQQESSGTSTGGFAHSTFAQLIAGTGGRVGRVVAGLALVGLGLGAIRGTGGVIVAVIGLVPIAAGIFDFCLLGPLFRAPFWGREIRAAGRRGASDGTRS